MTPVFADRIDENEYLFGDNIDIHEFSASLKAVPLISYK